MDWIHLAQDQKKLRDSVNMVMNLRFPSNVWELSQLTAITTASEGGPW